MHVKKSTAMMKAHKRFLFMPVAYRTPILKKGNGAWVEDLDGNRFLDLMSGQFSLALGHSHREYARLLAALANKIVHTSTLHFSEEVLAGASALASITAAGLKKTIFLSTGAEAVECALRHAKYFTGKDGVVALVRGYHGLTLATQSLSNAGLYAHPAIRDVYYIPTPDVHHVFSGQGSAMLVKCCLADARKALARAKGTIAAFIVEPVISVGGMIFPPPSFFKGIRALAREHKALLIFDECQTGLGRTGRWFGYEHTTVVPDMVVLAKAIGLGLPTSAVIMQERIARAIEGKIMHFSSHQNDPHSGATVAFLINYMRRHRLLAQIRAKGSYFLRELTKLSLKRSLLQKPRGLGLMLGFDVPASEYHGVSLGQRLISLLEEEGVIVQATRRGTVFRILPSFEITKEQIDFFISKLDKCLFVLEKDFVV
ncbi:MAG: aspartate aminotransferase family protein [Candidatus Omnitrophica bacterium]|nr:aspartate aminotransferase family protein [Candidatus Omnitrophota bacterium]